MKSFLLTKKLLNIFHLLRWNKPTGRLILLIPAGWSLWLTPNAPPSKELVTLIIAGAISVSGAGCIANDLWDRKIDSKVKRTKNRPLANGSLSIVEAFSLLIFLLIISLKVILLLPTPSQNLSLKLAAMALVPILIYPSSKRWFRYPQVLLAFCWGFAVLIPWAASEHSLNGGFPLLTCWLATMVWTFGFDTVYAMADKDDDKKLGLQSSALSLGQKALKSVFICYALTSTLIAFSALTKDIGIIFWPFWLIASIGMQKEVFSLKELEANTNKFGKHFRNQVFLGGLILFGLILGNF
ncbi:MULTISPECIES: 4-hydroxybenzoate polyprenyltransferase [Prochlorococcus]|uniref:4-hydroxybenzoate solanesyltransferase n=1 Tax=Prochlorococcus marinus (strain SARG / CCMP1375 / SS120) TaxID=167539 RepID=Q7VDC5_PROMA|nr:MULTISPECIES: 4-hydroxybenzoate polyprenyltransferase [Prochlorococcus]AAP99501.1 4-hydroxybenzoate polyprenyltransferase and related prenyltransferases [Prochlorococcus marinus subsp. marinus str. CCMP1375]KGG11227.1 Cyanobacterial polyprenyltransferase UbiA-like [Prochlorococcus marinus str. LG]KGG21565.1 Cyanobacterial polyprenyltransferase UbiA-like [Prochlorococcus marinus str. SS2]KGG23092.1 Cyanobacterial polyprenyltransferase UbiA-like [Prochlorococcus marinus str. SS35]KGG33801.1 C